MTTAEGGYAQANTSNLGGPVKHAAYCACGRCEPDAWAAYNASRKADRLRVLDHRIAACQLRRKAAIMRASRAVNSDEGALTRC